MDTELPVNDTAVSKPINPISQPRPDRFWSLMPACVKARASLTVSFLLFHTPREMEGRGILVLPLLFRCQRRSAESARYLKLALLRITRRHKQGNPLR